jgi:hypothetical protein
MGKWWYLIGRHGLVEGVRFLWERGNEAFRFSGRFVRSRLFMYLWLVRSSSGTEEFPISFAQTTLRALS